MVSEDAENVGKTCGMKRVIIESPWAGDINLHMGYLRRCMRDSLMRGEAPFASHRLYTFCLDDNDPIEREIGIQAGFAWAERADLTAVYTDFDISDGMKEGIEHAIRCGRPIEYRELGANRGHKAKGRPV